MPELQAVQGNAFPEEQTKVPEDQAYPEQEQDTLGLEDQGEDQDTDTQIPKVPQKEQPLIDGRWKTQEEKAAWEQGARDLWQQIQARQQQQSPQQAPQQQTQPQGSDPLGQYAKQIARSYVDEIRNMGPDATEEGVAEALIRTMLPSVNQLAAMVAQQQVSMSQREQMQKEAFFTNPENDHLLDARSDMEALASEFNVPPERLIAAFDKVRDRVQKQSPQAKTASAIQQGFVETPSGNSAPPADDLREVLKAMNRAKAKGDIEGHAAAFKSWARKQREG